MHNSLEALIASIKPELKIALDKTQKQSDALLAIDRLSDLLTLPAVDSLIAALEQAQRANAAQDDHINQQADRIESLEKKNGELGQAYYDRLRKIAELEARQLSVKLPDEMTPAGAYRLFGTEIDEDQANTAADGFNICLKKVIKAIRAAGGTVEGSE
jgi:hypothetical protein